MADKPEQTMLGLHNLGRPRGATTEPKRKGRGPGSGLGKTAGRGHKGAKSRSGWGGMGARPWWAVGDGRAGLSVSLA